MKEAEAWYKKCLAENEAAEFQEGIGISKGYLAQTLFLLGKIEDAETIYQEALTIALQVGRATTIARVHRGLAELFLKKGMFHEAEEHAQAAIPIYERLDKSKDFAATQALLAKITAGKNQG